MPQAEVLECYTFVRWYNWWQVAWLGTVDQIFTQHCPPIYRPAPNYPATHCPLFWTFLTLCRLPGWQDGTVASTWEPRKTCVPWCSSHNVHLALSDIQCATLSTPVLIETCRFIVSWSRRALWLREFTFTLKSMDHPHQNDPDSY